MRFQPFLVFDVNVSVYNFLSRPQKRWRRAIITFQKNEINKIAVLRIRHYLNAIVHVQCYANRVEHNPVHDPVTTVTGIGVFSRIE